MIMNNDYMDKLGILKGKRIDGFDLIENSSEIPLNLIDIIQNKIDEVTKFSSFPYIGFDEIAREWVSIQVNIRSFDYIADAMKKRYSDSCVYLDRAYREWNVTDLFSSIICYFYATSFINNLRECNEHINVTSFKFKNGYTSAVNISTPNSRITFKDNDKYIKDVEILNVGETISLALRASSDNLSALYNVSIIASDSNDLIHDFSLPLVGYKCLMETQFFDDEKKEEKPLSISIFDIHHNAMLIE